MSLYASVCNSAVVVWPLFIGLIVSFCIKITRIIYVTQEKLRENTGNFILARMWPPYCSINYFAITADQLQQKVAIKRMIHQSINKFGHFKVKRRKETVISKKMPWLP